MSEESHLLKSAIELAQTLNQAVDANLPTKLARIVKTHAGLAVGSALVPIPGVDMAAAVANIWAMYVRINKEINLPFRENIIKSIAAGVVTNLGRAGAILIVGSVVKVIPALGWFTGAVIMGTTIYAMTIAAGIVYMKGITRLLRSKRIGEVTEEDLKSATDEILKDKDHIKTIIEEGKVAYKNRDKDDEKMKCPTCGLQYPLTEHFCASDGTPLVK